VAFPAGQFGDFRGVPERIAMLPTGSTTNADAQSRGSQSPAATLIHSPIPSMARLYTRAKIQIQRWGGDVEYMATVSQEERGTTSSKGMRFL